MNEAQKQTSSDERLVIDSSPGNEQQALILSPGEPPTTFQGKPERSTLPTMQEAARDWLYTKEARTGSVKTATAYRKTLIDFILYLDRQSLQLDGDPRLIARHAQEWSTLSRKGRAVSTSTKNQRLAILSSFYTYAVKFGACPHNPIQFVERPPRLIEHAAPYLDRDYVNERLSLIDTSTREGKRDKALLSLALTTGRRASELAGLRWGDIECKGTKWLVHWRCKGRKAMIDELSVKMVSTLQTALKAVYGPGLEVITPASPIFVSFSNNNAGGSLSLQAISDIYLKHLGFSQIHVTRHTFAVNMEEAGASLSEIGERLGHSNYSVTAAYMKRLHSAENQYASKLEEMFGI